MSGVGPSRAARSLHEAVLDWRFEIQRAQTTSQRWLAHLIGLAAIARACSLLATYEAGDVVASPWAIRVGVWFFVIALPFHPTWDGWMIQRVLACAPIAIVLTLLTGPRSGRSPIAGLVVIEVVVLVCAAAGRPTPIRYVPELSLLIGSGIASSLEANRVRVDRQRAAVTALFVMSSIGAWLAMTPMMRLMEHAGISDRVSGLAIMFYMTLFFVATWALSARRQRWMSVA